MQSSFTPQSELSERIAQIQNAVLYPEGKNEEWLRDQGSDKLRCLQKVRVYGAIFKDETHDFIRVLVRVDEALTTLGAFYADTLKS